MKGHEEHSFLVVDDEPDMLWALENLLKREGFTSRKALEGGEALALTASHSFRMAFIDLKLPDMDGLELARRIKLIDPGVSLVLVSGYVYRDEGIVRSALEEGLICDFISKPFLHDELRRAIESGGLGQATSVGSEESLP